MAYRQKEVPHQAVTPPAVSNVPKMQHVEAQELHDKLTKGQLAGIRVWNEMRDRLIQAGIMEDK